MYIDILWHLGYNASHTLANKGMHMTNLTFERNGFEIDMVVDRNGAVRGEVYKPGKRFAEVGFSVGDVPVPIGQLPVSMNVPGSSASGDGVAVMVEKINVANDFAEEVVNTMVWFGKSEEHVVSSMLVAVNMESEDTVSLNLALMPSGVSEAVVREALGIVVNAKFLGETTTALGLQDASENLFAGLLAAATKIGFEMPEGDDATTPLAAFLSQYKA